MLPVYWVELSTTGKEFKGFEGSVIDKIV